MSNRFLRQGMPRSRQSGDNVSCRHADPAGFRYNIACQAVQVNPCHRSCIRRHALPQERCNYACQHIATAAQSIGMQPSEVWTVAGSGVLTRSLQLAWPVASFNAVLVGKKDSDVGKARRIIHADSFDAPARILPPFPSAKNYDAKAWEHIKRQASSGALLWNVGA